MHDFLPVLTVDWEEWTEDKRKVVRAGLERENRHFNELGEREKDIIVNNNVDELKTAMLEPEVWKILPQSTFSEVQLTKARGKLSYHNAVSPVIGKMFGAGILTVTAQIVTFLLVKLTATCRSFGVVAYPTWVLMVLLPIAVVRLTIEWYCIKAILPIYVCKCIEREVCPFKFIFNLPFSIWIFIYLCFSAANFSDASTDSSFTAVTLTSLTCAEEHLSQVWTKTIQQSWFRFLPMCMVDLHIMILGFWLLSFVQMLIPLITMVGKPAPSDPEWRWQPVCGESLMNEPVYSTLAEASGMATIQGLAISKAAADTRTMGTIAPALTENMANRVVWSQVCENCIQVNIQATLFAINMHLTKKVLTIGLVQALVSISLAIMMSLMKLQEALRFESFLRSPRFMAFMDGKQDPAHPDNDYYDYGNPNYPYAEYRARAYRAICKVRLGCLILVVSLGYAVVKLAAAFLCEDSMLNISGCVVLDE